jgi:hypothetical protein
VTGAVLQFQHQRGESTHVRILPPEYRGHIRLGDDIVDPHAMEACGEIDRDGADGAHRRRVDDQVPVDPHSHLLTGRVVENVGAAAQERQSALNPYRVGRRVRASAAQWRRAESTVDIDALLTGRTAPHEIVEDLHEPAVLGDRQSVCQAPRPSLRVDARGFRIRPLQLAHLHRAHLVVIPGIRIDMIGDVRQRTRADFDEWRVWNGAALDAVMIRAEDCVPVEIDLPAGGARSSQSDGCRQILCVDTSAEEQQAGNRKTKQC